MKRALHVVIATLALSTLVLGIGTVALAEPGPDPEVGSFDIFTRELPKIGGTEYDRTRFDVSQGWDWGLRAAYSCAYVEFIQGGVVLFEVHYEMVQGYPTSIEINDNAAADEPVNGSLGSCGDGIGPEANINHDGSDHFPHGTALEFSRDDQPLVTLDYHDEECARGYWTPGDEAGEAWLWWDEDGPTNNGHHDLNCGGGPGEPVAVVRAYVQHMSAGMSVCTTDMLSGDLCSNVSMPTITSHARTVELSLPGRKARGAVTAADGFAACDSGVPVKVQRLVNGNWRTIASLTTGGGGAFSIGGVSDPGKYRAVAKKVTLGSTDVCLKDTSPVARQ